MIKNEINDRGYSERITRLKKVLGESKLSLNKMQNVGALLTDAGADYFQILQNDSIELKHYTQYDLILKYHGAGEDFIVYIDFD